MTNASLALVHRVRRPAQPSASPPLLILLHGYGSNEDDLLGLAPYLDPRLLVVSARAPHALGGDGMQSAYAWFNLGFTPQGITIDPAQVAASSARLAQFVGAAATAYAADPARVYLLGFSQGAMMSAAVTLAQPELLAGAALLSGWIPPEAAPHRAETGALAGKPIFAAHGTYDEVLPIALGRAARDTLAALPVALTYREYPMAHEISAATLGDLAAWLTAQLNRADAGT